jgi:hypothetical protein
MGKLLGNRRTIMRRAIMMGILLVVCAVSVAAQDAISLYEVVPSAWNYIPIGSTVEFRLRVQIDTSHVGGLYVYNNGFRVYSPDGAVWDTTYGQYLAAWLPFGERGISSSGADGDGADTVVFGGEDSAGGFWIVYDEVAWSITVEIPNDPALHAKTICLDSVADTMESWPWSTWVWSTLTESYTPTWDGPHCFTIGCCRLGGDVDHSGAVNVADITYLVDYIFFGGPTPPCQEDYNFPEADADGSVSLSVGDLTYLVDYIFFRGPAPEPCP